MNVHPTRRALFGAPLVAIAAAPAAPHPDADLIRMCAEHIANHRAFNSVTSNGSDDMDDDDDPLWVAYETTHDAITTVRPQTIEGMVALARVAMAEGGPGATGMDERLFHSVEEKLAWGLVEDLLRLYGSPGEA